MPSLQKATKALTGLLFALLMPAAANAQYMGTAPDRANLTNADAVALQRLIRPWHDGTQVQILNGRFPEDVFSGRNGDTYDMLRLPSGRYAQLPIDLSLLPEEHPPEARYEEPDPESRIASALFMRSAGGTAAMRAAAACSFAPIHIYFGFSPQAAWKAGDYVARAKKAVAQFNNALSVSAPGFYACGPRLLFRGASIVQGLQVTGGIAGDQYLLENNAAVRAFRKANGIDIYAAAVTYNPILYCGSSAILPPPARSVLTVDVACMANAQEWSFAHEVGHIVGLVHNPENAGITYDPRGYGWRQGPEVPSAKRCIMSYRCTTWLCLKILYFANPRIAVNGRPFGTAVNNDAPAVLIRFWQQVALAAERLP